MKEFEDIYNHIQQNQCMVNMPSKKKAEEFIDELYKFLFPVVSGMEQGKYAAEVKFHQLKGQFQELLIPIRVEFDIDCNAISQAFFENLPKAYTLLLEDAQAILKGDPAANYLEEVILAYPGFFGIYVYRIAHELYQIKLPVIPRLFSEYAHGKTGIDLHPGAKIGRSFCIDHGTGIVIGETTEIGNNVKIYQGVTLGALSVDKSLAETKRHPTIKDDVVIYAGSTILGGNTVVGHGTVIGGNVWLTESVAPNSIVYHTSKVKVRNNKKSEANSPIDFII
ncbi:serine acetyltransferase [Limibacter armeniacum]|uniref:serine O-acetyltransferase n=1 Tax=Limibacter armeniacum TaxID=466084 RepID=UPI002FE57102